MHKKNYEITGVGMEGSCNLVRDFLKEVLPEIANDAVPNAYLYDLYRHWMAKNNSGSERSMLGRNNFYKEVRRSIVSFPEWHVPRNQFRVLGYLDKTETSLRLFGIGDWMQDPCSADPEIKYKLKWERPLMDGILRTKYQDRKVGRPLKKKCG